MKNLLIVLTTILLTACTITAPPQTYRPANYNGTAWNITGEMDDAHNMVIIKINDEIVINHALDMWSGSGEFTGIYKGKPVSASCMSEGGDVVHCLIFINGEKATTLTFSLVK